jgi:acetyl esterase/lipase
MVNRTIKSTTKLFQQQIIFVDGFTKKKYRFITKENFMKNITLKGFLKKSGIAILLFVLLLGAWVAYFLLTTEPPITQGEVLYDVEYKSGHTLDIYQPTKKVYDNTPVVFFIHGGAWIGGRKESINMTRFGEAVNMLRESGYTVITPSYTLAEEGRSPFPDCVNDVTDAVEWTRINADKYGFDVDNFGIIGESAGGHIAMMNAFPDSVSFNRKYRKVDFTYLIDVYGPTKLEGIYHSKLADSLDVILTKLPETISSKFNMANYLFGFDPKGDTTRANAIMKLYSPINYVTKNVPPVLIIHGTADIVVPFEQSLLLIEKLCRVNAKTEFHSLENVNHGFIGISDEQLQDVQNRVAEFVKRNYREE